VIIAAPTLIRIVFMKYRPNGASCQGHRQGIGFSPSVKTGHSISVRNLSLQATSR
jgi:hypothetical protein